MHNEIHLHSGAQKRGRPYTAVQFSCKIVAKILRLLILFLNKYAPLVEAI